MNDIYEDNDINIHAETFDKDFDEVGFEPEVIKNDSDEESKEMYGY